MLPESELLQYATDIVAAYVSNNEIPAQEVPVLLNNVFGVLLRLQDRESASFSAQA